MEYYFKLLNCSYLPLWKQGEYLIGYTFYEWLRPRLSLVHNGPAVCFSKRNPTTAPPRICPGRSENCHGARRVWRGFWHPGTNFNRSRACRGTKLISETNLSKCNKCYKKALVQCRGTSCLGARYLSRCRIIIASRCACPGTWPITNLSWVQELTKTVTSLLNIPSVLGVRASCLT